MRDWSTSSCARSASSRRRSARRLTSPFDSTDLTADEEVEVDEIEEEEEELAAEEEEVIVEEDGVVEVVVEGIFAASCEIVDAEAVVLVFVCAVLTFKFLDGAANISTFSSRFGLFSVDEKSLYKGS